MTTGRPHEFLATRLLQPLAPDEVSERNLFRRGDDAAADNDRVK